MFATLCSCCFSRVVLLVYARRRTCNKCFMQAYFGYNPFSDKNKIPGLLRKCLSFLYEPHTNMLVLFLLTAVNLETMWCIHVCHRCHVDVFLQVTVLFQVDFFVPPCLSTPTLKCVFSKFWPLGFNPHLVLEPSSCNRN